jgi:hypothetical protein
MMMMMRIEGFGNYREAAGGIVEREVEGKRKRD